MPRPTESLHPAAKGLDALPESLILARLLAGQAAALNAVDHAIPAIEAGARLMARAIAGTGRLIYAGAGSSALMASADGLELGGTFGIDPARIVLSMAGGLPTDAHMPGGAEDDEAAGAKAAADIGAAGIAAADVVIAVTASGSTPWTIGFASAARQAGAAVIGIANNPGAALFGEADVAICLPTPPELVAGSTRMGAGTAQKAALNLMSTLMAVRLGAVHDGMMVGLVADNDKLRARAAAMVATIAGVDAEAAARALSAAGGAVRPAVLIARGLAPGAAAELLSRTGGHLRAALAAMTGATIDTVNQGRE